MKRKSLKEQAALTAVSGALVRAAGFGMRLWISRLLGSEALGIMELASNAHMLALTPAASGLPQAVSRLTARGQENGQDKLALYAGRQLALAMGLIITPLFFLLLPLIAQALGDGRTLPALLFFSPCMLAVGVSSVYDGYFFGQGRAWPPALSEMAEQAVRLLIVAVFSRLVGRVTAAYRAALPALASSLGEAAGLLVILLLCGAVPSYRKDKRLPAVRRELLRLALPLTLNRFVHTGLRSLCGVIIPLRLMAGGLGKAEALSRLGMLNGMVMPLMFLPGLLSGALSTVGGPAMARCGNRAAENRLIKRMLLSALGIGAACACALYASAPLLAGMLYRRPEAAPLIRLACPLAVLLPLGQVCGGLMTGLGLQKKTLKASLLGSAVSLLFTWQWTKTQGVAGSACASMLGHGLTLLMELAALLFREKTPAAP